MLPKQFVFPKKTTTITSPNHGGLVTAHREETKGYSKTMMNGSNKNVLATPTRKDNKKTISEAKEKKIRELVHDISDAKKTFQESKNAILNELSVSQNSLLQQMQAIALHFLANNENTQELSKEDIIKKTEEYSNNKQPSNQNIDTKVSEEKEINTSLLWKSSVKESVIAPIEDKSGNMNLLWNIIEIVLQELQSSREIAIEENRKYIEAIQKLEEVVKERRLYLDMTQKYEKIISESDDAIQQTYNTLIQFSNQMDSIIRGLLETLMILKN